MTPQVYCARLERALSLMPAAERQETIRYYLEFLEDASEEERAALGTPEALAQQILRENGISPQSAVIKHSNRTAKLIVLACTFYIWLPLLVTWYSLLLTALIVLICIPVSLGATLLGGLFSFVITVFQDVPTALMLLGFGLDVYKRQVSGAVVSKPFGGVRSFLAVRLGLANADCCTCLYR